MLQANVSALAAIVRQLCPRCRSGRIFRKSLFLFPGMYERCETCGLKFEREPGYFLGAMYIGYALALAMIAIFSLLLWGVVNWQLPRIVLAAVLLFLPFAPLLTLLARVFWIYLDQAIDPDRS
jgi:uncharacterized protein (DUF983 family)